MILVGVHESAVTLLVRRLTLKVRRLIMCKEVLWILLVGVILSPNDAAKYCNGDSCEEQQGMRLLEHYNDRREELCKELTVAVWNNNADISDENNAILNKVSAEYSNFTNEFAQEASQCNWSSFSDPLIQRQFQFLVKKFSKKLPPEEREQRRNLSHQMETIFGTAKVCPYTTNDNDNEERRNCSMTLDNDIQPILEKSTNFDELLYYWKAWRDETGRKIRDIYTKYIPLINKVASINGFPDAGAMWRDDYDVTNLSGKFDEIFSQVLPLYEQLHAYVRRKLIQVYGKDKLCADGPIPAHLTGHMMGESWANLANLTLPYPNKSLIDITPVMQERNMTVLDMVKISEDFFQSMGLAPMTPEFWNRSIFERIPGRDMQCHPGSLNLCNGGDFRIVMCGRVNMYDLQVIHHEMGHIEYFMYYADQPPLFRDGANEGFHEAIGDTIALSVFTPTHWKTIGFLENVTDDEEQDINALFSTALDKVAKLPHAYVVDKWLWDLFNGTISIDEMNKKWWEYRLNYQGNCPSVRRTEEHLDAAALFHIPFGVTYARYFSALVLQFQFHKALCNAAGHSGPLHKCDIYGSKEAGELLKTVMSLGASKPWPEVLKILTDGAVEDFDAAPMLEYFQPLKEWLEKENENEFIGWNSDDATICP